MVISKQISLSLVNYDDRWSEYDFQWAKIFLKTKFDLDDGRTETINIGRFTVVSPETYGTTIEVIAMDDSYKLDKDYESGLRYPVRISEALRESCSKCDVSLNSVSFENDDYVIQEKPEKLTHRQFIGLCAMIAGGNARFDEFNRLEIITYDFLEFEKYKWLDGGIFDNLNPYAETYETGDDADGGSFKPWNTGYIADGGAFGDRDKVHILYDFKSGLTVDTDDVVITGVKLKGKEDKEYLFGKEGYVLSIENALASGQEEHTAALIGQKIVGLQFRPFSGDHISYPLAEFGDLALVIDRKQNVYRTVLTDVNFVYYGFTSLKCSADSPLRNSSKYYGNEVKAIVEARQNTEKQLSEYDKNVQIMTSILANSMGMFTTVKKTESGGEIIYQHDKPTLEESQKIWKKSEDGFLVSSDGGETWNAGMDSSGNAFLNVLSVVGFYFDWAKGGTLTLGGYDNQRGTLKILDEKGVQIGEWGKEGVICKGATIEGVISSIDETGESEVFLQDGELILYHKKYPEYVGRIYSEIDSLCMNANGLRLYGSGARIILKNYVAHFENTNLKVDRALYFGEYGHDYANSRISLSEVNYEPSISVFDVNFDIRKNFFVFGNSIFFNDVDIKGNLEISGDLNVNGSKNRIASTKNYGCRTLSCYEMSSPMFGDIGQGQTDENGKCYIDIGDIFSETVNAEIEYQVFLQKEGEGDIWISEKNPSYFVVKGTENLKFSWEIKAKQKGFEYERLESYFGQSQDDKQNDYELDYIKEIEQLIKEQEEVLYETA